MKTIVVATDFSPAAENAARYALHFAKNIKAGIKLCHAFKVPAEAPMAAQVAWPLEDYATLKEDITADFSSLAEKLSNEEKAVSQPSSFHPGITYGSEIGAVTDVARNFIDEEKSGLLVMGTWGNGELSRVFLGSNSKEMVEKATFPVLLVPTDAAYNGVKKIAFATDLSKSDVDIIHSLGILARPFNAEILIAHVTDEKYDDPEHQQKVDSFLSDITGKADYPKVYYRHIKSRNVNNGLEWLAEHGQVDILAMVHRPHSFFKKIFIGSHTEKIARQVEVPLLVFPEGYHAVI
jgi:nucleotide-binding universal stress UspA family protein